jgi:hypothetical protein
LQETSCFPAGSSSWLVKKFYFFFGHFPAFCSVQ